MAGTRASRNMAGRQHESHLLQVPHEMPKGQVTIVTRRAQHRGADQAFPLEVFSLSPVPRARSSEPEPRLLTKRGPVQRWTTPMTNVRLMRPVHRALMFGALVAGATLATRGVLLAHAMLLSSDPKAGSELTRSPQQVRLVFSEAIDASVSGIRLVPPRNAPLDLAVIADPRDAKALVAPLAPLAVGMYRVVWRTVSVDGHAVNGSFGFTVRGDRTMP